MNRTLVVALALGTAPLHAFAQGAPAQVVKPPVALYWMSVETAAGMSLPGMEGMGALLQGMPGGQAASGRRLLLQLGSQRSSAEPPRAAHEIPAGLGMGAALPLLTPRSAPSTPRGEERDLPEGVERPRGRMLLYWGCGETVRAGQPLVIDFSRLAQGQVPPQFAAARRIARPAGPAPGRSRTYGEWPNAENATAVPVAGSLRGEHQVRGNYAPDIRFALEERHDFMPRVALSSAPRGAAGALSVQWSALASATGYFATAMGGEGEDVLMWSSSESQEMGGALMDYLPPAEAARLVREKVVLPPTATECTLPAEFVKKAGTPFLSFIAYGEEANFAQPPRPQDPRQAWEPLWAAKVRFKSTASLVLGQEGEAGGATRKRRGDAGSERAPGSAPASTPASAPTPGSGETPARPAGTPVDPLKEGVNLLRGIFGR